MKEIISIHIGQTGIQMSSPIWELFCLEHNISLSGEKIKENEIENDINNKIENNYQFFIMKIQKVCFLQEHFF